MPICSYVVIPEEGVAYLRVDGRTFEAASVERYSTAPA